MKSANSEVAIFGRQTLGLKAGWWGWAGLVKDTVPVVADSRSEELTDGQETPFLPPSLPPSLPPLLAAWDVLQKLCGQLARAAHQLTDCVYVFKEHPLGDFKGY